MNPRERNTAKDTRLLQVLSELPGLTEGLDQHSRSPQLDRVVAVTARCLPQAMPGGKPSCPKIASGKSAARIQPLDGVYPRQDFEEIHLAPRPRSEAIERVRHADDALLGSDKRDGLPWIQASRDFLVKKVAKQLPLSGHHLLAQNDKIRGETGHLQGPAKRVVVRDRDLVKLRAAGCGHKLLRARERVFGSIGVGMQVNAPHPRFIHLSPACATARGLQPRPADPAQPRTRASPVGREGWQPRLGHAGGQASEAEGR